MKRAMVEATVLFVLLSLVCATLETTGQGAKWRSRVDVPYVQASELPRWRSVRILCRMGVLRPSLGDLTLRDLQPTRAAEPGLHDSLLRYSLEPTSARPLLSTEILPQLIPRPDPRLLVASVVALPADLYSPSRGIVAHPEGRGRAWERPAAFSLVQGGRLLFEGMAGLRIAGHCARLEPKKHFRLFFSDAYGPGPDIGAIFGEPGQTRSGEPVQHLTFRSWRSSGELGNCNLGYKLARRLSVAVPAARPCLLYINGRCHGLYGLTEQVDADFCGRHYGHDDFNLFFIWPRGARRVELGPTDEPVALAEGLWNLYQASPAEVNRVEAAVDLSALVHASVFAVYSGAVDAQPYLARDRTVPRAKWFPVFWDLDDTLRPRPECNALRWMLGQDAVCGPLLTYSPTFQQTFRVEMRYELDTTLSADSLLPLVDQWAAELAPGVPFEQWAWGSPSPDQWQRQVNKIRDFIKKRPEVVRRQLWAWG